MEYEVVVTRKGQTTIPAPLRKKYNIKEGTRMIVRETSEGIVFILAVNIIDLAGSGSPNAELGEMRKNMDRLRNEDL
ncbi:MAG: AbrB/MazE/SpoVT family DNA-binding domain-containing protein [Conexivisphaerales archaeon]